MNNWYLMRPDAIYVWSSETVRRKLSWYMRVMLGKEPPKFMIARSYGTGLEKRSLSEMSLTELLRVHDSVSEEYRGLVKQVMESGGGWEHVKEGLNDVSLLDLKVEILYRLVKRCSLCEHRCGIDRRIRRGVCRVGYYPRVSSYFLHLGEEAPLVPSGTIFYTGCNFRCVFCQNYDISQVDVESGIEVNAKKLARIQEELAEAGARNINHVGGEPTPNMHVIVESMKYLNKPVPQLWNSNMYMTSAALNVLRDLIDIWLPDFKYGNNECALRLSAIKNYFDVVTRNLSVICSSGDPIIVRHLVLPNHLDCCTEPVLRWIAGHCRNALVNIMDQYRPMFWVLRASRRYRDIARRLYRSEIMRAYSLADELGLDYKEIS